MPASSTVADYVKSRSLLPNSHANAKRDVNRSGLSPAQLNAKLQREIAANGGVANRQSHGPITKAAPDRFWAGVANAAGGVANLGPEMLWT